MARGKPPPPTLNLDDYVPGLVTWLSNKLSAGASRTYRAHFDLGVIDWRVLSTIAAGKAATAVQVCQVVGLDKAAVSRSFALLQQRDLIQIDQLRGRARHASLSAHGWQVHGAMLKVATARQSRLLEGISETDRTTLIRLLHTLLQRISDVDAVEPEG